MDDQQLITKAKADLSWIQKHERILIVFLVLVALIFGVNKYINYAADQSKVAAAIAIQNLESQKKLDADKDKQNQEVAAQYQAMVAQLSQQNAQLSVAVVARNQALTERQQQNNTLPLPELAHRWADLLKMSPTELTATASGIAASDGAAHATVNELEKVPVLEANLTATQAGAASCQATLTQANTVMTGLNTEITGLKGEVKLADSACKAEVKQIKADADRSKRNWFIRGLGVGAAAAVYIALHL